MKKFSFLLLIFLNIIFTSCSQKEVQKNSIKEKELNNQVFEAYEAGLNSLEEGDALFAAKKFNEAEILFPQSEWAPKSALMAAYSYYSQDYYGDSIAELKRFVRIYPKHKDTDYAYYLLAISYYEQIVDEKKDLKSILNAKKYFNLIMTNYPNTEYAIDSEFKIKLINELLAAKEMYIGRYYFDKKKWIPAINRFKTVVDEYETTIYIEEALHRLVEIFYILGLKHEAEKYAHILGYNYESSEWYKKTYTVFFKMYENNKKVNRKDKNKILEKFKSLLN